MKNTSYYSKSELASLGLKSIGENVLISKYARFYGSERISIGSNVRIDDFAILSGNISIGSFVHIGAYSSIMAGDAGVDIGDFCGLSTYASVFATSDDFIGGYLVGPCVLNEFRNVIAKKVVLIKHSHIGSHSLALPGSIFEIGASLGAMSINLGRRFKEWSYYYGNPAKKMYDIDSRKVLLKERELRVKNTTMGGGCRLVVILLDTAPLEHLSLGMQCDRFVKFRIVADSSLASYPKFSKNSHSHTANIRMLGDSNTMESLDSKLDSGVDSALNSKVDSILDSNDSTDSKRSLESNKVDSVCGTHPKEASSGERESVREGEGSELRVCLQLRGKSRSKILSLSSPSLENGRLEKDNLVVDSKELKDSKLDSPLDSKLFKDSGVESDLDSSISLDSKDFINLKDSTKSIDSKHPSPILRRAA